MERIKKIIKRKTKLVEYEEEGKKYYRIEPDKDVVYNIKLLLKNDIRDWGYFDAVDTDKEGIGELELGEVGFIYNYK